MKKKIKKKFRGKPKYYYDNITINSFLEPEELMELLPPELIQHCKPNRSGKIVYPASNTGRYNGYKSKIDVSCAQDEFIELLKSIESIGRITRIDVTRELIFKNERYARAFQKYFDQRFYRKWSRGKGFKYVGEDTYTSYQAKQEGKKSRNYTRIYQGKSKILMN